MLLTIGKLSSLDFLFLFFHINVQSPVIMQELDSNYKSKSLHNFYDLENGMYVISVTALETNQVYYQRMLKVN